MLGTHLRRTGPIVTVCHLMKCEIREATIAENLTLIHAPVEKIPNCD